MPPLSDYDNTAPVAIAPASYAMDNAAPVAIAVTALTPDNAPPVAIAAPALTPDNSDAGAARAVTVSIAGNLAVNARSEAARVPDPGGSVRGVQLGVLVAPVGAALNIDLVDEAGTSLARVGSIPAGQRSAIVSFAALARAAGSYIGIKVTQVGSTTPGADLSATFIIG